MSAWPRSTRWAALAIALGLAPLAAQAVDNVYVGGSLGYWETDLEGVGSASGLAGGLALGAVLQAYPDRPVWRCEARTLTSLTSETPELARLNAIACGISVFHGPRWHLDALLGINRHRLGNPVDETTTDGLVELELGRRMSGAWDTPHVVTLTYTEYAPTTDGRDLTALRLGYRYHFW